MRSFLPTLLAVSLASVASCALAQDAAKPTPQISSRALDATAPPTTLEALSKAMPVTAEHAMVVSAQHLATQIGVQVLKDGGNAVDAAVAVGYALAVVHPCCGNIGGGGFMVVHLAAANGKPARNLFLDFREKAPLAATPTMFQDADGNVVKGRSTDTYLGVGVPGTVMGLETARTTYGTLSRKQLMQPAIELARKGYVLQEGDVKIMHSRVEDFAKSPNVARIFLKADGQPYAPGDRLVQTQLADTLERIEKQGTKGFYAGKTAKALVAASQANGGIMTLQDLAQYTAPWSTPINCGYRGYQVVSAPPPSSGGVTLCQILGMVQPYPLSSWGYGSAKAVHHIVEAERRAFADRNTYLGDPAFVTNPIERMLDPAHVAQMGSTIDPDKATPSSEIKGSLGPDEGTHTTHYSVVDAQGNAVSVTYTINYLFGIGQIAGDTGFFLNNEMDDFTSKPGVPNSFGLVQGKTNQIEPGKRPLSSMTPTILLKDGRVAMVTGSPGGSTIISTTMESIVNVLDFGMNMQQSVNAPRFHNQWLPDVTAVEPGLLSPEVRQQLEAMGHSFRDVQSWGADEAILRNPKTGLLEGANDRRRPAGLAAGY